MQASRFLMVEWYSTINMSYFLLSFFLKHKLMGILNRSKSFHNRQSILVSKNSLPRNGQAYTSAMVCNENDTGTQYLCAGRT